MKIGIVSDTHSRQHTVDRVLQLLQEHQVDRVLHCGDIEDADTVRQFAAIPTWFVFGNCDDDRNAIRRAIQETGAHLEEPYGYLEMEGRRIAWVHGDDKRLLRDLERPGAFDYLFYGHTHIAEEHQTGPTRVINPGALHRARVKSFVLLDLSDGSVETVIVT